MWSKDLPYTSQLPLLWGGSPNSPPPGRRGRGGREEDDDSPLSARGGVRVVAKKEMIDPSPFGEG